MTIVATPHRLTVINYYGDHALMSNRKLRQSQFNLNVPSPSIALNPSTFLVVIFKPISKRICRVRRSTDQQALLKQLQTSVNSLAKARAEK